MIKKNITVWILLSFIASMGLTQPVTTHITKNSIWNPKVQVHSLFVDCLGNMNVEDCIIAVMKTNGASTEAIDFTIKLAKSDPSYQWGYMDKFIETGTVDVVSVNLPLRANANQIYVLVNGFPEIISTENPSCDKDINKDPLYPSLLKKYPDLAMWFNGNTYKGTEKLPDGGQRILFTYYLVNGCHACGIGVDAIVAFDFDRKGKFLGTKFLKLVKTKDIK